MEIREIIMQQNLPEPCPAVAIVILNWNGRQYLQQFLPSVLASQYSNFFVVVADNASTDDSVAFVKEQFPEVKIVANHKNLGFAAGYNEALKQVKADYFVLLNSDVEVDPHWLSSAVNLLQSNPQIAVVQPKLIDYNDRSRFEYAGAAGGFLDKYGYPFCRGRIFDELEEDKHQYQTVSEIFWASGAALFIRSSVWRESQGFDGDFFAHMEEIDLCWRIKNMGYKIMYSPQSVVYHIGGGTLQSDNPFKSYLNFRNNLVMLLKNLPRNQVFFTIFLRFWLDFASLIKFLTEGKFKQALSISKAHRHFFRDFRKNIRKRNSLTHLSSSKDLFRKSVVWEYFVRKRKTYNEIINNS